MNYKIGVILGGPSPEHDISILTGLQSARVLSAKNDVSVINFRFWKCRMIIENEKAIYSNSEMSKIFLKQ